MGAATAARALASSRSDPPPRPRPALSLGSPTRPCPARGLPPGGPTLLSVPANAARAAGRHPLPPFPPRHSSEGASYCSQVRKGGFQGLGPRSPWPLLVSRVSRGPTCGPLPRGLRGCKSLLPKPGGKSAARSGPLARSETASTQEAPLPPPASNFAPLLPGPGHAVSSGGSHLPGQMGSEERAPVLCPAVGTRALPLLSTWPLPPGSHVRGPGGVSTPQGLERGNASINLGSRNPLLRCASGTCFLKVAFCQVNLSIKTTHGPRSALVLWFLFPLLPLCASVRLFSCVRVCVFQRDEKHR